MPPADTARVSSSRPATGRGKRSRPGYLVRGTSRGVVRRVRVLVAGEPGTVFRTTAPASAGRGGRVGRRRAVGGGPGGGAGRAGAGRGEVGGGRATPPAGYGVGLPGPDADGRAGFVGATGRVFIRCPRGRVRVGLMGKKLPSGAGVSTVIGVTTRCHSGGGGMSGTGAGCGMACRRRRRCQGAGRGPGGRRSARPAVVQREYGPRVTPLWRSDEGPKKKKIGVEKKGKVRADVEGDNGTTGRGDWVNRCATPPPLIDLASAKKNPRECGGRGSASTCAVRPSFRNPPIEMGASRADFGPHLPSPASRGACGFAAPPVLVKAPKAG